MNYKALVKTFIPSKYDVYQVFIIIGLAVSFVALLFGISTGIYYGLEYFFGGYVANVIIAVFVVLIWIYILIISPLYRRYQNIKWELGDFE